MLRHASLLLTLCLSVCVNAQDRSLRSDDPLVRRLIASTRAMNTVRADLVQEKHIDVLNDVVTDPGTFVFERPDRFRWSIDGANDLVILTDGESVRVREKGEEKKLNPGEQRMYGAINGIILHILSGDLLDDAQMAPSYALKEGDLVVTLHPQDKQTARRIAAMVLRFDTHSFLLKEMWTDQVDGDRTVLRFTKVEKDVPVDPRTFTDL
ncbi:MAG: outer membrane lipoprotein carrier protein LolA [Flavobacteriales bacterium]|nr:outer membrane lipoprotein carrier protein LolA [Flavobacteriales bacterium]